MYYYLSNTLKKMIKVNEEVNEKQYQHSINNLIETKCVKKYCLYYLEINVYTIYNINYVSIINV